MYSEREYLKNMQAAIASAKVERAYYQMEGAHRFESLSALEAATISVMQAASLTPIRDIYPVRYDGVAIEDREIKAARI